MVHDIPCKDVCQSGDLWDSYTEDMPKCDQAFSMAPFCPQGKSFIKEALKCKAHALRHRFGCISRKCPAIRELVLQLQRECYLKHDLCSAARANTDVLADMIHFKDLLQQE